LTVKKCGLFILEVQRTNMTNIKIPIFTLTLNLFCYLFQPNLKLKSTILWDITPCSPLRVNRRFGGTYRLHLQDRKIGEAKNQRESTWVDSERTTLRYIPEDGTLQNYSCENLKSYIT
jgi:hypothetical protein